MKSYSDEELSSINKELQRVVREYFKKRNIKRHGNERMKFKSFFMLTTFLIPIVILNLGILSNPFSIFILYVISGFGMAGIGMGIMHDALHGSYSKDKWINRIMGYSIFLIGANESIWKIQHNVLHHTYTNIEPMDDDLNTHGVMRFSPNAERKWFHAYQHYYAWILYGLMTLVWMSTRDFVRGTQYKKLGFFSGKGEFRNEMIKSVILKIMFVTVLLIMPILLNPVSWYVIFISFLGMHFLAGIIISLVFQTAHVMPDSEFPELNYGEKLPSSRLFHQLSTTCNYGRNSNIFSWYIGALNFQIEHHLFPDICHVHYKGLSEEIRTVIERNGLPYNSKTSFVSAIGDHYKMLKKLGEKP
jgi:linoleoyl-CoA desaturase